MFESTFLNPKNGLAFCKVWTSFLHFWESEGDCSGDVGNCEGHVGEHVGACLDMIREVV